MILMIKIAAKPFFTFFTIFTSLQNHSQCQLKIHFQVCRCVIPRIASKIYCAHCFWCTNTVSYIMPILVESQWIIDLTR